MTELLDAILHALAAGDHAAADALAALTPEEAAALAGKPLDDTPSSDDK